MIRDSSKELVREILFASGALIALVLVVGAVLHGTSTVSPAQGGESTLNRGRLADAARLTALAEHLMREAESGCEDLSLKRGRQAEVARLTGQAAHYSGLRVARVPVLNRARIAESMRFTGIALNLEPASGNGLLAAACVTGQ